MNDYDKKILAYNGWMVVCESPFEIEYTWEGTTSCASGAAAHRILDSLKEKVNKVEILANEQFQNVGDEGLFPNYSDKDIWIDGFIAGYEYHNKECNT
jgi:hypothetical protein